MHKDRLKRKLTVEEVEAESVVTEERLGRRPVGGGFIRNYEWRDLIAQMQPSDELWEFSSPRETWQHLCGRGGIALVRRGEVVASIVTAMN